MEFLLLAVEDELREQGEAFSKAQHYASGSPFDTLCLDVLDCIITEASKESSLRLLARVNKTFLAATQRCSQALVVDPMLWLADPKKRRKSQANQLCRALSKDVGVRPNLSRLVLPREAAALSLWPALKDVHWSRVKATSEENLDVSLQRLSNSRNSLDSLDLEIRLKKVARYVVELNEGLQRIMQAFPGLRELKLRGNGLASLVSDSQFVQANTDRVNRSLTSLELLNFKQLPWPLVLRGLKVFSALRVLRFGGETWLLTQHSLPSSMSELGALHTLHMDITTEAQAGKYLSEIAHHCPNLRRLQLCTHPSSTSRPHNFRSAPSTGTEIEISDFLRLCPHLERVALSRCERTSGNSFIQLLSQAGLFSAEYAHMDQSIPGSIPLNSKILILRDEALGEGDLWRNSCSVSLFRCVLFHADFPTQIHKDQAAFRDRFTGEAKVVSQWWNEFC